MLKGRNIAVLREYTCLLFVFAFLSCTSAKKVKYFNGLQNGTITSDTPVPESVIQKNDILTIPEVIQPAT